MHKLIKRCISICCRVFYCALSFLDFIVPLSGKIVFSLQCYCSALLWAREYSGVFGQIGCTILAG